MGRWEVRSLEMRLAVGHATRSHSEVLGVRSFFCLTFSAKLGVGDCDSHATHAVLFKSLP
ncbi:hypothetical protein [Moorena sp. SIO3A2]|uniref:hypothetical protein n=1 Tax=Moorena sp. SIO3A2 TaxID=2607841 RepID=UPI0013B9B2E4|nr:hypothetical protein [Moorena sp. SIO3A2]NER89937.1 hypothetical protein [Moorena sp. SIO3A2]